MVFWNTRKRCTVPTGVGVQGRDATREAGRIQGDVIQGVVQREGEVKYKDEEEEEKVAAGEEGRVKKKKVIARAKEARREELRERNYLGYFPSV